ncbi:MAG: hypothetical protein NC433_05240 [Clostridiales bacterium]|nr:hypothetical protein [Clostridiales bacterium]
MQTEKSQKTNVNDKEALLELRNALFSTMERRIFRKNRRCACRTLLR